jgi:hypothetical protein
LDLKYTSHTNILQVYTVDFEQKHYPLQNLGQ